MRVTSDRATTPSEAIVDSQSVKSAAMVNQAVGYDAGKRINGRKRFLTVDTLGLVPRVLVTAASVGEREGGKQALHEFLPCTHKLIRSVIAKTFRPLNPPFWWTLI